MPRGRKRNPEVAPSQVAGDDVSNTKREKATVEEEEVFINIIDSDDPTDASSTKIEPISTYCDTELLEEVYENNEESSIPSSSSRTTRPKRKLAPPRLTNTSEVKPKRSTQAPVRGGARTRAMAVHETMLEAMQLPKSEDPCLGEIAEADNLICENCGQTLYSQIELQEHQRAFHKDRTNAIDLPSGTLLCSHPHCTASFPDVAHLIAHLVAFHSQQQYRIRKITFDSIDKFWDWKLEHEKNYRCKFMGTADPEEHEDDCFEFTSYCEYCYDWREQEEKGPAMAEQLPRKLIGCPAYFTASVDNKKKRAAVIGCFSHLGHHKKVTWTPTPGEAKVTTKSGESVATIKCDYCDMMFRSRSAATRHHRMVHTVDRDGKKVALSEPKQPSLECADPECDTMCDSMIILVQHVAEAHKVDVSVDEYKFPDIDAFERWKTEMEQSTCSKFCKVSGRVLPNEITKYFLCHLSGHTNRTKKKDYTPQEKQRNRPTKKMGRYCTAFMSFKQNRNDGSISVRGCLRHFGHPLEVRRLPLPEQVRKEVSDLLMKGMIEEEVVSQIRSMYNENERGHHIQRYEVRNIALKLQREGLILASKTYIHSEEDGRLWDEMGFPEDAPYVQQFMPIRTPQTKLIQFKPVHHARAIPISSIHGDHIDQPTHSRYITRPGREQVQVVQYVEGGDFMEEDEIAAMEDGEAVYYEQDLEEEVIQDMTEVIPIQHVVEHIREEPPPPINHGGRKRMPLLKEPIRTGNPTFDDVMAKLKTRFNKISQQLKVTQDQRLAQEMLKELKELQQRIGAEHSGIPTPNTHWNDDFFDEDVDIDPEGYEIDNQEIGHEEEVNEDGYEDEYIDPSGEDEITA